MANQSRQYDIVVFGATGYTGKYTCEHIVAHFPTDLKWAVAGRSANKLQGVVDELKHMNADRIPPSIEESSLDPEQLAALARKTKILLTTVGPYARFGTPVVEACIKSGTHYFDITGETPWVREVVQKYHDQAKAAKVIIIPQIGVDSAPADLLTWSLVTHVRRTLNQPVKDVNFTVHEIKSKPSGGTLASLLGLFDVYSLNDVRKAMNPWSLSPIPPNPSSSGVSLVQMLTGVKTVSDLGTLTTSIQGPVDRTQVYRSWGLMDAGKFYGSAFRFHPFMTVRNAFIGLLVHSMLALGGLALVLPPVRWLLKKLVYAPGQGPTKDEVKSDRVEYRAIATAETSDPAEPKRSYGRLTFHGSMYHMTGVFLAEAAISLLKDESLAKEMGGGVLTPATLGAGYIERLQKVGFTLDLKTMP